MSGQGAAQKARNMWRSLTSMGTALVLLFLLALAAIPGALLPQRGLNAAKVDDYLAAHPLIGPWLDELQAFDVFSSFWFTAIYVLLFVSLVGCLAPRTIEHARSLRATPTAASPEPDCAPKCCHCWRTCWAEVWPKRWLAPRQRCARTLTSSTRSLRRRCPEPLLLAHGDRS